MTTPIHPLLYEINTRCWLRSLSEQQGRAVTLANVPDAEIGRWRELGFTHIWAMGVWTTGPRSRALALEGAGMQADFAKVLPDWTKSDAPGSPYAISDYQVPAALGGEDGLKTFREKLNSRGLKLLLDFVPNHVGLDHPWVTQKPELFVSSQDETPGTFQHQTSAGRRWLAHGKDPNFPPWIDTVQLDYRRRETHAAMTRELQSVARRCDGVRCDMAMLVMNEVFANTWARLPQELPPPATGFWARAIPIIKEANPNFIFMAEAYWGLEPLLQSYGFDYAYNKTVYDLLRDGRCVDLQKCLLACPDAQLAASVHFLENHDEPRAAALFPPAKHRAAALVILGLPGMRMLYEGQLEGRKLQVPAQLGRWPDEPVDQDIRAMYKKLLGALKSSAVGHGEFRMLHPVGWPGNDSERNFIIVQWQKTPLEFDLVVVNAASHPSQCRVQLAVAKLAAHDWEMRDLLGSEVHRRHGAELHSDGLYLDLPGNGAQLFRVRSF